MEWEKMLSLHEGCEGLIVTYCLMREENPLQIVPERKDHDANQ